MEWLFVLLFPSAIVSVVGCKTGAARLAGSATAPNLNTLTKCRCPPPPLARRRKTLDSREAFFIAFKWRRRVKGSQLRPRSIPWPLRSRATPGWNGESERCKPHADRWPSCQTTCVYKGNPDGWLLKIALDARLCTRIVICRHFLSPLCRGTYTLKCYRAG